MLFMKTALGTISFVAPLVDKRNLLPDLQIEITEIILEISHWQ